MSETFAITNEQINDLPLLLGIVEEMGVQRVIDTQIRPHGNWEGISVGTAVSVREWAADLCWLVRSSARSETPRPPHRGRLSTARRGP